MVVDLVYRYNCMFILYTYKKRNNVCMKGFSAKYNILKFLKKLTDVLSIESRNLAHDIGIFYKHEITACDSNGWCCLCNSVLKCCA